MADQSMEATWRTALWRQFGSTIAMLEQAVVICPAVLWPRNLWESPADSSMPPEFAAFWYLAYHALFWCDLYLSGLPEEDFTPPAPFIWSELDPPVSPAQPYTKEELLTYLADVRRRCQVRLSALTGEQAQQAVSYPWMRGETISYLELQLYNMRHIQEHAAQLSLFLGQHASPATAPDWVTRARDESGE